jgi:hypothetical protein
MHAFLFFARIDLWWGAHRHPGLGVGGHAGLDQVAGMVGQGFL